MGQDNHYGVWYKFEDSEENGVLQFTNYLDRSINKLMDYNPGRDACFSSFVSKYRADKDCYLSVSSPIWFTKVIDEINKLNNVKVTVPMQLNLWSKMVSITTRWGEDYPKEEWSKEDNGGRPFSFPLFHIQLSDKYNRMPRFFVMGFMCYLLRAHTLGEKYCNGLFDDPKVDNYLKFVFERNNIFVLRRENGHNLYEKEMTLDIFNLFDNVDLINQVYGSKIPRYTSSYYDYYMGIGESYCPTPAIDYLVNNKDKYLSKPPVEAIKPKRVRKVKNG